jgi:protein involved in temperature-dependent protein secretion
LSAPTSAIPHGRRLGDRNGALADLDASVDIDPANVDARRIRAQLYEQRGEREKAAADLEVASKGTADPKLKAEVEKQVDVLRKKANENANSRGREGG